VIKNYEEQHYPMDPPTPVAAIRFRMEQQGLRQTDLIPFIGSKSRVSEVMNGRRALTLAMIRKLHEGLGISLEVLIQKQASAVRSGAKKGALGQRGITRNSR
jgi:HTH-type transcriptional regulator/antitoxin HigA